MKKLDLYQVYEDHEEELTIGHQKVYLTRSTEMLRTHLHSEYEVLLVPDGVEYFSTFGTEQVKGKGPAAVLVAPFIPHFTYYTNYTDRFEPASRYIAFYVKEEYFKKFQGTVCPINRIMGNQIGCVVELGEIQDQVKTVIDFLFSFKAEKKSQRFTEIAASANQKLAFGTLVNLLDRGDSKILFHSESKRIGYIPDVIRYLVENIQNKTTGGELAKRFFVSRDKLNRDFYSYTRVHLGEFMGALKITRAKQLLKQNTMSVREIAENCGFENDVPFYAFFKKQTGTSPREYLRELGKSPTSSTNDDK